MKKIFLFLLIAIAAGSAQGQSVVRTETLKTTDLGNQKLTASVNEGDTTYVMYIKTGERVRKYVAVILGNGQQARHYLQFLQDVELKGDDFVILDNKSNNVITKNIYGGLRVYDDLRIYSGQLRKPNIKGFLKAIDEYEKK